MSNKPSEILQDAFDLIEDNKLQEARALVKPLLDSDASNPTVWWIYAHAVEDPQEGIEAIEKVLELDSTYPGASELRNEIRQSTASDNIDDFDDIPFEEDMSQQIDNESNTKRRGLPWLLIGAVVIVIILIGIFALLSGGSPSPPPTSVADIPTDVPTTEAQIIVDSTETDSGSDSTAEVSPTDLVDEPDTPSPTSTDEPQPTETLEPTEEPNSFNLTPDLVDLNITENDVDVRTTALGETLTVTVCSALGTPQSSTTLNTVMGAFVDQETSLADTIQAVGVTLVDCDIDNAIPRTIGVARESVRSLANETIELKDFQRAWQPLQ